MTDEMDQSRGIVFIQTLPDDQLLELRRAVAQEIKRRGLKAKGGRSEGAESGAPAGRKRARSGGPQE